MSQRIRGFWKRREAVLGGVVAVALIDVRALDGERAVGDEVASVAAKGAFLVIRG